jgi:hypothetical protein
MNKIHGMNNTGVKKMYDVGINVMGMTIRKLIIGNITIYSLRQFLAQVHVLSFDTL